MGETVKDPKDNSSSKDGQPSEGTEGITSTEPQTYSQEQLTKAISDALAKAGRDDKSLSARDAAVKAREDALAEQDRQRDAAELAEAQKDPGQLAVYQKKQADKQRGKSLDDREAEINRSKAENEAEITAARERDKEITIISVASAKGIDPVRLKTLSEQFNVEGKEKLEELAAEITSGKKDFEADNAMTKGVHQDWHDLSPDEKIRRAVSK